MKISDFAKQFPNKLKEIEQFAQNKVSQIVGVEAVNHFKESFDKQGFTDQSTKKWQDVERRDKNSSWYGFQPGNKKQFSQARAVAGILTGETGELREAITYRVEPGAVIVSNDKPYARVHNYGGSAKVFGKTPFQMPQRQFMGHSRTLSSNINKKIVSELTKIIKK